MPNDNHDEMGRFASGDSSGGSGSGATGAKVASGAVQAAVGAHHSGVPKSQAELAASVQKWNNGNARALAACHDGLSLGYPSCILHRADLYALEVVVWLSWPLDASTISRRWCHGKQTTLDSEQGLGL